MLAGVMIACYLLVHLQILGNVLDQRAHGCVVLLASWHIETLQKIFNEISYKLWKTETLSLRAVLQSVSQ